MELLEMNGRISPVRVFSDKPVKNESGFSRNVSDATRVCSLEQKRMTSELNNTCTTAKSCETPVKLLIAQEMSKEVKFAGGQPNVVAKLMGLDVISRVEPDSSMQRMCARSRSCSQNGDVNWADRNMFKDAHETGRQSWNAPCRKDCEKVEKDAQIALLGRRLSEAKRFSKDEDRCFKEFQDALEVLSSNKDAFLECLQERTSVSSEPLDGWHSVTPSDKRRITVLLPSKNLANLNPQLALNKDGSDMNKGAIFGQKGSATAHPESCSCSTCMERCKSTTQRTRIVVLKPGPQNFSVDKLNGPPRFDQSRQLYEKLFHGCVENAQNHEPRGTKVAREHAVPDLDWLFRDQVLIASGPCNSYTCDDPNPRCPDNMSPLSRHSWDNANRIGSPISSPSYGQMPYCPDYSDRYEARKRLSERWATNTVTYDGTCNERMLSQGSSKSLGEMLALSEARNSAAPNSEEGNAQLLRRTKREGASDKFPRNLIRSNSLPESFPGFGTRLDVRTEEGKRTSVKLSFKGMLSSLFSSRNRGSGLEKAYTKYENVTFSNEVGYKTVINSTKLHQPFPAQTGNRKILSPMPYGGPVDNQNRPCPVLLVPHVVDECMARGLPQNLKPNQRCAKLSPNSCESNLIGKSPAIGTVPRTISCNDLPADTTSAHPATRPFATPKSNVVPDWMMHAKTLLSVSGLQDVALSSYNTESWHSLESPLDPSLRDRYVDLSDKETLHEANRRRSRSTRNLVYDCVNTALMQITGTWLDYSSSRDNTERQSPLVDKVLALIDAWCCGEALWLSDEGVAMDNVVQEEVVGWWWMDQLKTQMNDVNMKIAGSLMENLMHDMVVDLAGGTD